MVSGSDCLAGALSVISPSLANTASPIGALPVGRDTRPMEARAVYALLDGSGWRFQPKWDGFRCLAFGVGNVVELRAKSGKPLGRYFPEIVSAS
jgi:ATP-dependent DNA ligase